eukprot:2119558-Pleurochrysis_carterae.AAC.1
MPRIPVPPLCSVVELFSSETRYVNNDSGCPPVGTPCTRPSCSSMTHVWSTLIQSKFWPIQSTFMWNNSSSSRSFERIVQVPGS